jgi:preprotein translocase subunit SecG
MLTVIVILILIACVLLIGVVLIQNPKGGGLSSTFGGMSNQIMGVQRTTDFLEKSTWTLMIGIAVLSLFTIFFIGTPSATPDKPKSEFEGVDLKTPQVPQQQAPAPQQQQQQPQGNTANPMGEGQPGQQPAQ